MRPLEPTCGVPERRHASYRFLGSTTGSPQATRRSSSNSQLFAPHIRICNLSQVHLYALRIFRDTNENTVPHEPPLTAHGHIHTSLQKITPSTISFLIKSTACIHIISPGSLPSIPSSQVELNISKTIIVCDSYFANSSWYVSFTEWF